MGFQVNGVEWINSSGHFTQGLKTAQNTAMTGTGSMTTNSAADADFGTTRNSVGSIALGVAYDGTPTYVGTSTASFGYNMGSTVAGIEPFGSGSAGSTIRDMWMLGANGAYPFNASNWRLSAGWWSGNSHLSGQTSGTDYIRNFSGTWSVYSAGQERGTSFWPSNIYMRIS
ncbi:hypothetical protein [uncultured Mediterranean phage uvMED]|nr:hypothetical protein [uncultured Mediterranean phage uvMED]BAR19731.1 hypothetical protein [uncultured Mediterranean phage uvMED]